MSHRIVFIYFTAHATLSFGCQRLSDLFTDIGLSKSWTFEHICISSQPEILEFIFPGNLPLTNVSQRFQCLHLEFLKSEMSNVRLLSVLPSGSSQFRSLCRLSLEHMRHGRVACEVASNRG